MNVVTLPPPSAPPPHERLLTIEDVAALPSSLPTGDVKYELDEGRLVIMAPPGDMHGSGQARIITELTIQAERAGHGIVRGEVGVILRRNPDRLVGPDAVFIANRSLPLRLSPEGYLETIPDLVVEIRSKNDTQVRVERKVAEYLRAGVTIVLVPDPDARTITAYRHAQAPQVFSAADALTVPDVIPGFQVAVAALFTA
jgi:Uma2 family endonuclease